MNNLWSRLDVSSSVFCICFFRDNARISSVSRSLYIRVVQVVLPETRLLPSFSSRTGPFPLLVRVKGKETPSWHRLCLS